MLIQKLHFNRSPASSLLLTRVILKDMIHLLESAAFSLRDEEVRPDTRQDTEDGEKYVGSVACVFD